jgi:hypothetical protein
MDERVAERFTAPGDEVERFMYLCSLLLCVPTGLADAPSVATGTVMRTATLQGYAAEAGFGDVQVLPIEHPFWRFLPLDLCCVGIPAAFTCFQDVACWLWRPAKSLPSPKRDA